MTATAHVANPTAKKAQCFLHNPEKEGPVIDFIAADPTATIRQVARGTGLARLHVERVLNALCASGRLEWKCREAL